MAEAKPGTRRHPATCLSHQPRGEELPISHLKLFDDCAGGPCQVRPSGILTLGIEGAGAAADIHAAVHFLFPRPAHMPCSKCGASVVRDEADEHVCDPERLLDYRLFQLRGEIEGFDGEVAAYLDTPLGRFEAWYAERHRHGKA